MSYSRRKFIQSSTAAAAVAMSPIPGMFARSSPADRVNIGLIGCRNMGFGNLKNHLEVEGVECVGLCDVDQNILDERISEVKELQGKSPGQYTDYRKLLENKDLDAVIIGTPDHWHCLNLVDACEAGKDVYVEKPIANSIYEAQQMVNTTRKYNRVVQAGQQQRSGKHWARVVDIVRNGSLGNVREVKVWAHFHYGAGQPKIPNEPVPEGINYDMWLGPAPERPYNANRFHGSWRHQWDYGGGLMTDWGVHLLDIVLWAMGVDVPRSVHAAGGIFTHKDNEIQTADTQNVIYDYGDFIMSWEHLGGIQNGYFDRNYGIAFIGDSGFLIVNRSGWEIIPVTENGKPRMEAVPFQEGVGSNHKTHAVNFIESIRGNASPNCTIEDGYNAAFVAHMGNIAYRTGTSVRWNPDKGNFKHNKEANDLLKPEYRKPWKLPAL